MDVPTGSSSRRRTLVGCALLLLGVVAARPYFATLGYWPMTADPPTWIGRGTPLSADWLLWVFAGDHYSWYRPVTALSFALDEVLGGVDPRVYRITDLVLHLAVGLAARAVFTRWVPAAPRWAGVAVAFLVWAHPCGEEVVPYMARRSYSLAALFGCAALCSLDAATRNDARHARAWAAATGGWLALAALSNEGGLLAAPVLAGLVWARTRGRPRALVRGVGTLAPAAALGVAVLLLRTWVLRGPGGYGEVARLPDRLGGVVLPAIDGLLGAQRWNALAAGGSSAVWTAAIGVALTAYYGIAAVRALRPAAGEAERVVAVMLAWIGLAVALYAAAGIFTPRQVYGLQVPLAVVLVGAWCVRRGWVHALPPLAVAAALVLGGPVVRGQRPQRLAGWADRQRLLQALHDDLGTCVEPAVVRLVLPNVRPAAAVARDGVRVQLHRSIRQPADWTAVAVQARGIDVRDLVYLPREGPGAAREQRAGRPALRLPPRGPCYLRQGGEFVEVPPGSVVWLDELSWPPRANGYLYAFGPAGGTLELLHPAER